MVIWQQSPHVSYFTVSSVPNHNGLQQDTEIQAYNFMEKQEVKRPLLLSRSHSLRKYNKK